MIGYLRGTLHRKTPQAVIIECGGIGFQVLIPLSTYKKLPELEEVVALEIITTTVQDAMVLVGFSALDEKALFTVLTSVTRIGVKGALSIIGNLTPREFVTAIENRDISRLSGIHGIGKKTAERLIVECRDKLPDLRLDGDSVEQAEQYLPDIPEVQVAYSALINLGYRPSSAAEAVKRALASEPCPQGEQALIRAALRQAAKSGR